MKDLYVIGAGGHARQVVSTALLTGCWRSVTVIDTEDQERGEFIGGTAVMYGAMHIKALSPKTSDVFIAVGENHRRAHLYSQLSSRGFGLPNLIHPSAFVDELMEIGTANYIGSQVNISPGSTLGDGNIINNLSNVDHESRIGNFCHLSPGSVVCGRSHIGNSVWLGANATIIDGVSIADECVIGAGAVITKTVDKVGAKLVGVPGRQI